MINLDNLAVPVKGKAVAKKQSKSKFNLSFGNTWSFTAKRDLYRQLYLLLTAGLPLQPALEVLRTSVKGKKQVQLEDAIEAVTVGAHFSTALQDELKLSAYEFHSLRIGEESGRITQVLESLSDYFESRDKQRRLLLNALAYPLLVLFFAMGAVVFLLRYIVPLFADIFKSMDGELPWLTQKVMAASDFLSGSLWWMVLLMIGFYFLWRFVRKTTTYRRIEAAIILRIPVIGSLLQQLYLLRYYRSFSLLLESGVRLTRALELLEEMLPFYPLQEAVRKLNKAVHKGQSLSDQLQTEFFFSPAEVSLTKVGEETNSLPRVFKQLADNKQQEAELKTELLGTIMEPILIILVGILVGVILIALYLPMFQLGSMMK